MISDNTITGNGVDGRGGVRLGGDGNVFEHNIVSGNNGPGVLVPSGYSENLISENSFFDNAGNAIDHLSPGDDPAIGDISHGVSDNEDSDLNADAGAGNDGLDHPELDSFFIDGDGLHILGVFPNGREFETLEFYIANSGVGDDDLNGVTFGEGEQFIGCLLYTSPSPRDQRGSRMPSSA